MSNKWNRADALTLAGLSVSFMSLIVAIITFATPEVRRCIGLESGGCIFSKRKTSPDSTLNSSEKTNTNSLSHTPKQSPSDSQRTSDGVAYSQLERLLAMNEFVAANKETRRLMLRTVGFEHEKVREPDGSIRYIVLTGKYIEQLPCSDLRTIDQLWQKYSTAKFGFGVQKKLWRKVNGNYSKFQSLTSIRTKDKTTDIRRFSEGYFPEYSTLIEPFWWGTSLWSSRPKPSGEELWEPFFRHLDICQI